MSARARPISLCGAQAGRPAQHPRLPFALPTPSSPLRPQQIRSCRISSACNAYDGARSENGPSGAAKVVALIASGVMFLSTFPLPSEARITVSEAGDVLVGPPKVIDGDTLVVANERIRLFGMDAPESKQSCQDSKGQPYDCGVVAAEALRKKIGSGSLQCQVKTKDMYSRNVSSCSLPGTGDIGDWMVKNGHAVAYRQYSSDYAKDEEEAKNAHRGIWQGKFEMPADWRKENKREKAANNTSATGSSDGSKGPMAAVPVGLKEEAGPPKPGCDIKGNISGKGDKIYHVPGGRYYDRVKIEQFKGESFFCSEKEAEKAGFRKSSQ